MANWQEWDLNGIWNSWQFWKFKKIKNNSNKRKQKPNYIWKLIWCMANGSVCCPDTEATIAVVADYLPFNHRNKNFEKRKQGCPWQAFSKLRGGIEGDWEKKNKNYCQKMSFWINLLKILETPQEFGLFFKSQGPFALFKFQEDMELWRSL